MSVVTGVSDHAGWAELVSVDTDSWFVVDRRRVEVVPEGMPRAPVEHEAQGMPLADGVALVQSVRDAVAEMTEGVVRDLAADVGPITGLALRACPDITSDISEQIRSYHLQTRADSVMYRDAFADAAHALGIDVSWFDPKTVFADAAAGGVNEDRLTAPRKELGPPWRKEHRMAMAAALIHPL